MLSVVFYYSCLLLHLSSTNRARKLSRPRDLRRVHPSRPRRAVGSPPNADCVWRPMAPRRARLLLAALVLVALHALWRLTVSVGSFDHLHAIAPRTADDAAAEGRGEVDAAFGEVDGDWGAEGFLQNHDVPVAVLDDLLRFRLLPHPPARATPNSEMHIGIADSMPAHGGHAIAVGTL